MLCSAIDLSHHLSEVGRARNVSPLKDLQKYFSKDSVLSLAGGLPSPAYFPFSAISADVLIAESFPLKDSDRTSSLSWLWKLFSTSSGKEKTVPISIPKYPLNPGDLSLSTALQYGMATGVPQLQKFIQEFAAKVFQPGYDDFATLVHAGNTDGWSKLVVTLCNPGEGVLTDEWTYPSAMATIKPYGVMPVPISMDGQGMRADRLREVLSEWNESVRGMPRPHVIYIVPVGQNPSGATMGAARKMEIYELCVEYDVIIVEDDPYFFMQEGPYLPKSRRTKEAISATNDEDHFIASLEPSFLKYDFQGRVVRLDTFSKTIAPGCRLGWFTCNPIFAERLERAGETSTQAPCGFGQSLVTSLLLNWKREGYLRWLQALGIQYKARRDFFIDCLAEEFQLHITVAEKGAWEGSNVYVASRKNQSPQAGNKAEKQVMSPNRALFSFVPPTSGMFIWMKLHFDDYAPPASGNQENLEMKLWIALAQAGVIFAPGKMFSADFPADKRDGHFRISFSNAEYHDLEKAVKIFGTALRKFHNVDY